MPEEDELAMAERHVLAARQTVARQRQRLLQLETIGADTLSARQTLDVFEASLRIFEDHRDYLKHQRDGQ